MKTDSKNLENVKEMGKFLDTHDLPKLNQETPNNLDRPVMSSKMEAAIVSQYRGQDSVRSYQALRKRNIE